MRPVIELLKVYVQYIALCFAGGLVLAVGEITLEFLTGNS